MSSAAQEPPQAAPHRLEFALFLAAATAAVGWFAVLRLGGDAAIWLPLKGAPVGLLALAALRRRGVVDGAGALAAALAAHAAGDLLLELAFLAGMAAFFAGHLLYVALFWRRRLDFDDVAASHKLTLGLLALVGALFLLVLAPRLRGPMVLAVPIYASALVTMTGAAWLCRRGRPWVPVGAVLFLASDALLSLELFAEGVPGGRLAVWPLYALGQGAIAWGWLRSADRDAPPDAIA